MPFKSQAQRGFLYAKHPDIAKRWEGETPPGKLPAHVVQAQNRRKATARMKKRKPYAPA